MLALAEELDDHVPCSLPSIDWGILWVVDWNDGMHVWVLLDRRIDIVVVERYNSRSCFWDSLLHPLRTHFWHGRSKRIDWSQQTRLKWRSDSQAALPLLLDSVASWALPTSPTPEASSESRCRSDFRINSDCYYLLTYTVRAATHVHTGLQQVHFTRKKPN